jgi:hypothetical protein
MGNYSLGSTAKRITYDGLERPQLTQATQGDELFNFYDGSILLDAGILGGNTYDTLTVPGSGEVLAFSSTPDGGGTPTLSIPINDAAGSALGMVNSSGTLATEYTYDPLGATTTAGLVSANPFLYGGLEFGGAEPGSADLYSQGGNYYSPQLGRVVSPSGPIDANTGGSGGNGGTGSAGGPSGGSNPGSPGRPSGGSGGLSYGQFEANAGIGAGAGAGAGGLAALAVWAGLLGPEAPLVSAAIYAFIIVDLIVQTILDALGLGGSTPSVPRQLFHRPHSIQHAKIGLTTNQVAVDQKQAANPEVPNKCNAQAPLNNGNLWGSFTPQDGVCTVPIFGGRMNSNPCMLGCCKVHDNCYTANCCNYTSWLNPSFMPVGSGFQTACDECNGEVLNCIQGCK